jgi:hypothetical protein
VFVPAGENRPEVMQAMWHDELTRFPGKTPSATLNLEQKSDILSSGSVRILDVKFFPKTTPEEHTCREWTIYEVGSNGLIGMNHDIFVRLRKKIQKFINIRTFFDLAQKTSAWKHNCICDICLHKNTHKVDLNVLFSECYGLIDKYFYKITEQEQQYEE